MGKQRRLVAAGLVLCACLALLAVDYASRPMAAELTQAQFWPQQGAVNPQGLWGKNLPGVGQPGWREAEVAQEPAAEEEADEDEEAVEETDEERQAREQAEEHAAAVAYARSAARARERAAPWYVNAWEKARQASADSMRAAARAAQEQYDREAALNATNGTEVEEGEGEGEVQQAGQFDFAHAPWHSWFKIKAAVPAPWETIGAAVAPQWDSIRAWNPFAPVAEHAAEDVNGTNGTNVNGTDAEGGAEEREVEEGEENLEATEDMAGGEGGSAPVESGTLDPVP